MEATIEMITRITARRANKNASACGVNCPSSAVYPVLFRRFIAVIVEAISAITIKFISFPFK